MYGLRAQLVNEIGTSTLWIYILSFIYGHSSLAHVATYKTIQKLIIIELYFQKFYEFNKL